MNTEDHPFKGAPDQESRLDLIRELGIHQLKCVLSDEGQQSYPLQKRVKHSATARLRRLEHDLKRKKLNAWRSIP